MGPCSHLTVVDGICCDCLEDLYENCEHLYRNTKIGDMSCEFCGSEIGPDGDGEDD